MTPIKGIPPFPDRADDVHKGNVGRVVIVGGRFDDVGMVGAPALAANAALRTGAGLVQILTTKEAQLPVSILAPCATTRVLPSGDGSLLIDAVRAFAADVVAIGPGLTPHVTGADVLRLANSFTGGVVIDADGLNALARLGTWSMSRKGQVVITPHPGEMRRLLRGLGQDDNLAARSASAKLVADATGTIVVLKGAGTVVSDGEREYVNATGHSGMATGGSGDVLTGMIAALMGQGMNAFDASVLGVYLHGRAGEHAGMQTGMVSMTATDLLDGIGRSIDAHRAT